MNDFDAAVSASSTPDMGQAARLGYSNAVETNPDAYAEAQRVARRTGVPVDTVLAYPNEMKRQASVGSIDFAKLAQTSPATARLLADQEKAKVAHDDVGALQSIENAVGGIAKYVFGADNKATLGRDVEAAGWHAGRMLYGVGRAAFDVLAAPEDMINGWTGAGPGPLRRYADVLGQSAAGFGKLAKESGSQWAPNSLMAQIFGGGVSSGVQSGITNLGTAAAAMYLFGPQVGIPATLAVMALGQGGDSYQKAREAGKGTLQSLAYGAQDATAEYVTEKYLGMGGFLERAVKGASLKKLIAYELAREVPGEMAATLWQNFNEWTNLNPGKGLNEFLAEQPVALAQTVVATLVGGTIQSGAFKATDKLMGRLVDGYDEAEKATKIAQFLVDSQAAMQASKLLERSPETLNAYLQEMVAEGVPSIYLDGKALAEDGVDLNVLAQAMPSLATQGEAMQRGGDLVVPTEELLIGSIGTGFEQALIDHARTSPNAMSRVEAQAFMDEKGTQIKADMDRAAAAYEQDATFKADRDSMKDQLLTQLNAVSAGMPKANELHATLVSNFYAVMAARQGMTTSELYAKFPLRVARTGQGQSGQQFDQATKLGGLRDAAVKARNAYADFETAVRGGQEPDADTYFALSDTVNKAEQELATALESVPDDAFAVQGTTPDGRMLMLNTSAQKPGHYQLTRFGKDGTPWGDTQYPTKAQALRDFMDEADIATVKDFGGELNQDQRDLVVTHNLTADNLLHAVKMGGIAVPSLAVTKKDTPLAGFGEITLIGAPAMADPKGYAGTKVFGADIYSPRYPSVERELDKKGVQALVKELKAMADRLGTGYPDGQDLERNGQRELERNLVVMATFLQSKGIEPTVVQRGGMEPARRARLEQFGLGQFMDATNVYDLLDNPEFVKAAVAEAKDAFTEVGKDKLAAELDKDPDYQDVIARDVAREIVTDTKPRKRPEADSYATQTAMEKQIAEADLANEFQQFVAAKLDSITKSERIFQGFTNSGNRKYIPHTLENVVKLLKKELRGGESFNYGVGSLRAKFTPQFKSVADIRKNKDRLISAADFDKIKDDIDTEFLNMAEAMGIPSETLSAIMEDATKMGVQRAAAGYKVDVGNGRDVQIAEFMTRLRNLPTAYFEAKIMREVDLAEFAGAVVPDGVNPEVIKALRDRGVNDIRTYKNGDEADRAARIGEFENLFFQGARGTFNPDQMLLTLSQNADLSTFIHESGHFFLEALAQMAADIQAREGTGDLVTDDERGIVADFNAALAWMGVEATPELSALDHWHSMTLDEKRESHEKWARGFEAYAFEGKAPEMGMHKMFQTFRAWMVNIYKQLKNLDVKLNDDIRGVFDRMLATSRQIEETEAARSMGALFESAEKAGMTVEEFKAYHELATQATMDAVDQLQAKTLKDMQWLDRSRSKYLKALQKQHDELRAQARRDVTRDVMSQPVYQAWQFLTGKTSEKSEAQIAHEKALADWKQARADFEEQTKQALKDKLLADNPDAKGIAKGQLIAKSKRQMGIDTQQAMLGWDRDNARPTPPEKPAAGFDGGEQIYGKLSLDHLLAMVTPVDLATLPKAPKTGTGPVNPETDSILQAIAKLGGIARDSAKTHLGVHGDDFNAKSGVFGKPVFRKEGGKSADTIGEALAEMGYLPKDENGKYDIADLETAISEELGGTPQYSTHYDYSRERMAEQADEAISQALPIEVLNALKARKMTAKEGLHPDMVAEKFGFSSGDEMVRALAAATPPKAAIDAATDARMMAEHADLSTPEAMERAADEAVHNEARARFVATELSALEAANNVKTPNAKGRNTIDVMAKAAKEYAQGIIARLKVRDIKPSQYAAAEARAARNAMKATGDLAAQAEHKRNQLINLHAAKAAYEAKAEVDATLRRWKQFATRADAKLGKTYDMDVANAVRAILGEYGIAERQAKRAAEYLGAVSRNDPEMFAILNASIEAAQANAQPVQELTLEAFRGLRDEIDSMLHLAKRSRQLEVDGNLLDRQDAQDALYGRMVELGIPETQPGQSHAITPGEQRMAKFGALVAFAKRMESWVESMDGSNPVGPFRRFVWNRIKDGADAYRADKAKYLKAYRALVESIAPTLRPQVLAAPELGYTFGKDSGGSAINEILHAILHTGNQSNMRKLLLGRGWAVQREDGSLDTTRWDAFINRMVREGRITKAHFDFAQGVWDLMEATKPLAQKTHRDVFGRYFDEVTADELRTPFGTYRGGYVPAMADTRIVKDAELRSLADEDNAALSYAFPTTPKGFTKARVEYNRPLMLDLRTLAQHIDRVMLFAHMEMPVRDVQRVLSGPVGEAIQKVDPAAMASMIMPWLTRSARQQVETPVAGSAGTMRFFSVIRQRAGMAAMMGNLANAVQQVTGLSMAMVKVKPSLLLSAAADAIASPRQMAQAVAEASPYMAGRMENEVAVMSDAINEILMNPSLLERGQAWANKHAYFLQSGIDNFLSPIVWTGAYNQAVAQGMSHADAVRLGDSAVRTTQGSTMPEDISRLETGNSFVRLFTQFAGYFNMQANLLGTQFAVATRELGLRQSAGRGLYVLTLGFLIPAIVGELIMQVFRGGPGDDDKDGSYLDDWLAAVFGFSILRGATAMVPVAGPLVNAGVNAWNTKPYDDRLGTSPALSMLESAARAPVSVYNAAAGDGSSQKAVRDVATLISMTVGLPANLAARPIGYAAGVAQGRIDPAGPLDVVRGAVTGAAGGAQTRP